MPHTPTRTASTSATAIGWVATETQRGQIITGSRSTSARIVSNAALPAPTIIAARSVVTGTGPAFRIAAVSALLRRCGERTSAPSPSPPRYTICRRSSRRCAGYDRRRGRTIERLEVAAAERVHEVVDDLGPVERTAYRSGVGRVCGEPLDLLVARLRRSSRHTDDLVLRRERPHERTADGAGGPDDGNPHSARPHGRPAPGTAWRPDRAGPLRAAGTGRAATERTLRPRRRRTTPSARQAIVPPGRLAINPPRITRGRP